MHYISLKLKFSLTFNVHHANQSPLKNAVAAQGYCHYEVLSRVTRPYAFVSLKKLGRLYWVLAKPRRQPEIFQGKVNNKFENFKEEVRIC